VFKRDVTLKRIGEYLKKFGWENFQEVQEPGEKEGLILTGWSMSGGERHRVAIDPIVEKGAVVLQAREVAKAPPDSTAADRLNGLLLAMSALNYGMILGSWGFDPSDGEVVFKVTLSIQKGDLDYEDFERALKILIGAVELHGSGLKEIVEGAKTAQEVIATR
jgi:hypothetical protein